MHLSSDLNRFERLGKVNQLRKVILSENMKTAEEIRKREKGTQSNRETKRDFQGKISEGYLDFLFQEKFKMNVKWNLLSTEEKQPLHDLPPEFEMNLAIEQDLKKLN